MKIPILFFIIVTAVIGCVSTPPPTTSYNIDFNVLDFSKDGVVSIEEFSKNFPNADNDTFSKADADNDDKIYPDEWYQFSENNGYLKSE